jgi:hypothetical protein
MSALQALTARASQAQPRYQHISVAVFRVRSDDSCGWQGSQSVVGLVFFHVIDDEDGLRALAYNHLGLPFASSAAFFNSTTHAGIRIGRAPTPRH